MILRAALLALFAAGIAVAADPFVGTWKPNLDHWKDSPGAPEATLEARKSQMPKWEATGKDAYRMTTLASDGKPVNSVDMIVDGKERQASETDKDLVTAQRLGKTHIRLSVRGSKGTATNDYVVSADGKVLTVTRKGTGTTSGRRLDEIHVYDKQ
jgi:hypothetical protein